jgi:hypothetical protein
MSDESEEKAKEMANIIEFYWNRKRCTGRNGLEQTGSISEIAIPRSFIILPMLGARRIILEADK